MWKKTPHNRLELETYCRVNTTRPCFKGKPGSANYYSVCNCIFPGLYGACFFFFLIGIHFMQGRTATTRHAVTRKRSTKILKPTGNLFRKNLQLKDVC